MTPITELQEVLLSYLCGLAPVGQVITLERRHAAQDLGYSWPTMFNQRLQRLVDVGAVKIITRGAAKCAGQIVVLKRPEAFEIVTCRRSRSGKYIDGNVFPSETLGVRHEVS